MSSKEDAISRDAYEKAQHVVTQKIRQGTLREQDRADYVRYYVEAAVEFAQQRGDASSPERADDDGRFYDEAKWQSWLHSLAGKDLGLAQ